MLTINYLLIDKNIIYKTAHNSEIFFLNIVNQLKFKNKVINKCVNEKIRKYKISKLYIKERE